MPLASPPDHPTELLETTRQKNKRLRQERQARLLELRRKPSKPKVKRRLWLFTVTVQTEMPEEQGLGRDIVIKVQEVDQVEAARQALDYAKNKLQPNEVLHGLKIGERQ